MHAPQLLPHWSPQTWFDLLLTVATSVEAAALWFLYTLERRQDGRNTRVDLPIRPYESTFPDNEGNPTCPAQPLLEVTNCAATAVYIEQVRLELEVQNVGAAEAEERVGKLIRPYSTDSINVLSLVEKGVRHALGNSVTKGDPAHAFYKALAKVTVSYRAYGKRSDTDVSCFEGEIRWKEFHFITH
jgi:hypothetical protein